MARRALVAATANSGKLDEFRTLLADLPLRVISLDGLDPVRFPEEGLDYAANALAKAQAVADQLGEWAVADDSGLEVSALGGAPGPLSARYGGVGLDDAGRVGHLLSALEEQGTRDRDARFVCFVALVRPGSDPLTAHGECLGRIVTQPRGGAGFGYDPIFIPEGFEATMAELPPGEKDRISHRGRAFARLREALSVELSV